ncbi:MAG: hypothetical protein IZT59_01500 [Verrucomicrobia bacterium]|nr:hypothetical protein [Verrucomicrobiota bacterium]
MSSGEPAKNLENYLHEAIPLSALMGILVDECAEGGVISENGNDCVHFTGEFVAITQM